MKMKQTLRRFFGLKSEEELEREKEITWRLQRSKLNRQIANLNREANQFKQEAVALEKQGRHTEAVSKAAQAVAKDKACNVAMKDLQRCDESREMIKAQKLINSVMKTTTEMSREIVDSVDVDETMALQAEQERMHARMDESYTQITAVVEGFGNQTDPAERNAAGEAALAAILAEAKQTEPAPAPVPVEETKPKLEPASAVSEEHKAERKRWMADKRTELQMLAE